MVALGDSRLKYATLNERRLAGLAESFGVPDLRFLRIVKNAATYADFEGLAEPILASRPDLLLIQLDLVLRERALLKLLRGLQALSQAMDAAPVAGRPLEPDPQRLQVATSCSEGDEREHLWARVTTYERHLHVDPRRAISRRP